MPEFVTLLNSHSGVHCLNARHTKGVTRVLRKFGSLARPKLFSGPEENCSKSCEHWAGTMTRALRAEFPGAPEKPRRSHRALGGHVLASHKVYDSAQRCQTQLKRVTRTRRQKVTGWSAKRSRGHHEIAGSYRAAKILAKFFIKSLRQCLRLRTVLVTLGSGGVDPDELATLSEELDQLIIPIRENLAKITLTR